MNERTEIRPSRGSNFLKMVGFMAFLVPASAVTMIHAGDIVLRAVGVLGLAFFGGGGAFALWSMTRTPWTLALAHDALEVRVEDFIARIPWRDIEAVGLAHASGQKMPSIRLARYDSYLASGAGERDDGWAAHTCRPAPPRGDAGPRALRRRMLTWPAFLEIRG